MRKRNLSFILAVIFLFLSASAISAATVLKLNSIGTSDTEDKTFTEWWYTGTNPQFVGEASPSASVTLTVDDSINIVTADVNGEWLWTPTALLEGDYAIDITSELESITFTLHLASSSATPTPTVAATDSGETKGGVGGATESGELPVTGAIEQTIILIGGGMALLGLGMMAKVKLEE